jgi:hypothetical protein
VARGLLLRGGMHLVIGGLQYGASHKTCNVWPNWQGLCMVGALVGLVGALVGLVGALVGAVGKGVG